MSHRLRENTEASATSAPKAHEPLAHRKRSCACVPRIRKKAVEVLRNSPFDHLLIDGVAGLIACLKSEASDPRSDKKQVVTTRFRVLSWGRIRSDGEYTIPLASSRQCPEDGKVTSSQKEW